MLHVDTLSFITIILNERFSSKLNSVNYRLTRSHCQGCGGTGNYPGNARNEAGIHPGWGINQSGMEGNILNLNILYIQHLCEISKLLVVK